MPKSLVLKLVFSAVLMAGALVFGLYPDGQTTQTTTVAFAPQKIIY
ncbi:hypothetical protein [Telmatospirillum sp.]|nr:hypothetical protein [Telmatospirillum sp.]MDR3436053.1 hypothetical protein [Telmatospirillum sp.]